MKNRPRPYIPLAVRMQVAERQFNAFAKTSDHPNVVLFRDEVDRAHWKRTEPLADQLRALLTMTFGDSPPHLDHDPPLRTRLYNPRLKDVAARYTPNANDPNHLTYRTEHEHRIKTNVRGEHGQHPDRVLIKRERKRERKYRKPVPTFRRRKLRSANRWPEGRKIQNRKMRR